MSGRTKVLLDANGNAYESIPVSSRHRCRARQHAAARHAQQQTHEQFDMRRTRVITIRVGNGCSRKGKHVGLESQDRQRSRNPRELCLQFPNTLRGLIREALRAITRVERRLAHRTTRLIATVEPFALRGTQLHHRSGIGARIRHRGLSPQRSDESLIDIIELRVTALDG